MKPVCDKRQAVLTRIQEAATQYSRDSATIRLLAVSKTQPVEQMQAMYACGQREFGENYLQEALNKQAEFNHDDVIWHFIGPIQSNKTRAIAEHFDWVHSVDRLKIARRLHEQRPAHKEPLNILLQVNIDNEASKSGVAAADVVDLAQAIGELSRLRLRGLMAIPTASSNFQQQRATFKKVAQLLEPLRPMGCDVLSMGMSADLEAAIAEGATIVRIGTALFGERHK